MFFLRNLPRSGQSSPRNNAHVPLAEKWTKIASVCTDVSPNGSPWTIRNVTDSVRDAFGHRRTDFMTRLQDVMSSYAKKLEDLVVERTADLLSEQKSCDDLLKELLPP